MSLKRELLIIICFVFLSLTLIVSVSFALFEMETKKPFNLQGKEEVFVVEKGEGAKQIAKNLGEKGVIRNDILFILYVLKSGEAGKIKAGKYSLSSAMTISQIAEKLVKGEVMKEKIIILEGWSLRDIERELISKFLVQRTTSLWLEISAENVKSYKEDYEFLKDAPDSATLEGYIFPDTYEVDEGETTKSITRKALDNFDKKLTEDLRKEIKKQNKSIFEIVTMASLLEKEVRTSEDKKIVSGIFWKRISIGQPLQSCATVAYAIGVDKWRYSYEDTRTKSPYNTYLNQGLPIGPISNPGLESIKAAIEPEKSDYWYYLSDTEGKTIFSKTFEEHNIAKAKYLK
ncbi:MAG: hypothetical protein COX37_02200 [Candidatus Nealsonbacteria bacterium CG23_combo_of_CG06-09_8_20_14_all_39_17]|uniref:Endolytic murein transglycosylase n=1 Tax=Candidatus Nealsonbacteria bacterium CG23_combo_of_CG06-09_8_20_14_all_39_17 TaxID=1974722 RepID=A0A2G9YUB9_9BACT|nr:MAG: hypothetical protein COX37_02200 [Candidatus Nealsonbacteria bacterium CG23_combo_of_CG06-09_8_20_14_all_39_17]PIU43736.1 MAG: endolytic transglycosylase MltG [Candidatus Nealsonbacteria bacterium CG07_land_8_20_14_0_80_39_13]